MPSSNNTGYSPGPGYLWIHFRNDKNALLRYTTLTAVAREGEDGGLWNKKDALRNAKKWIIQWYKEKNYSVIEGNEDSSEIVFQDTSKKGSKTTKVYAFKAE